MDRYQKNIQAIGEDGQKKLSQASVFIVGCGALGGHLAMLLAGVGIGRIAICDQDTISISNLQRQLYFSEAEAGKLKVNIVGARMRALNSEIKVDINREFLTAENAVKLLEPYEFIVDATDNPASKYFIDELALKLKKPVCIGGVAGWHGQVSTAVPLPDGNTSARFSDFFPKQAEGLPSELPCDIEGVIGAASTMIASIQASEIIKYFTGQGEMLIDKLLTIDIKTLSFKTLNL